MQQSYAAADPSVQTASGRLAGRRIVVTGAASGIGLCTAQLFVREGASVLMLDRDRSRLTEAQAGLAGLALPVDITDEAAVTAAVTEGATALGGLDGLVNAAGIMFRGSVGDVPALDWRRMIEVNLTGSYIVARSCLPWLSQAPRATIVNIGSAQGLLPNAPGFTAYAASKGGLVNLSRALAAELAPAIRVNCVCPGMVNTPMADGYRANVGNYALQRLAEPQEIAQAILFLTSHDSSYVTGATLAADGGRSFH
jgi:NAD(P)-dependent dehydrogenase (short-subunit alcohol dehydrogenase family)